MKLPITALAVLAVVPMLAAQAPLDEAAVALRRHAALVALDRYLETWNSRDAAVWATSLHFPHVRPGPGAFEMTRSPEEYVKGVNFEQTLKTGWHHSEWVTREVLQVGADKVHASGTWQRYTADGKPLAGSDITYIITRIDGSLGRAGALRRRRERHRRGRGASTTPPRRLDAVTAFLHAWNSHDQRSSRRRFTTRTSSRRWPGRNWRTAAEYLAGPEPGRQRTWYQTRIDSIEGRAGDRDRRQRHRLVQPARSRRRRSVERRRRFSRRPARRRLEDSGSIDDGVLGSWVACVRPDFQTSHHACVSVLRCAESFSSLHWPWSVPRWFTAALPNWRGPSSAARRARAS